MIRGLDPAAVAILTAHGHFVPPPAVGSDPVHAAIATHFDALAAIVEASTPPFAADVVATQLGTVEYQARRALFDVTPVTLQGLADLLSYALAFSVPAWRESDPGNEPIALLETASKALAGLLGGASPPCG